MICTSKNRLSGKKVKFFARETSLLLTGIAQHTYTPEWKGQRNTAMVLLRALGYGKRTTEIKILEETSTLVQEITHTSETYFDPLNIIHLSVTNIICYLLFNEKYDHGDDEFQSFLLYLKNYLTVTMSNQLINHMPLIKYLPKIKKAKEDIRITASTLNNFVLEKIKMRKEALRKGGDAEDFIQVNILLLI